MRRAAGLGLSVALSCAAPPAPVKTTNAGAALPPPPAKSAPAPAPAPPAGAPAPAARPALLEPASAPKDGKAHVEILFPFAEQRILIPKAAGYKVRTKVEGWALGATGPGVVIALDQHRPRRVLAGAEIELGELLDEGRVPAAGPHWMSLAAVDEASRLVRGDGGSRAPFAQLRFWVGERDPARAPVPMVALLSPSGTYNGELAASAVSIDFLALPERLGKGGAKVVVSGPNVQLERRLESWQPLTLRDLPDGDFSVAVALLDERGQADEESSATRTFSVNRELGPDAKKP